jgi:hypothetical protein
MFPFCRRRGGIRRPILEGGREHSRDRQSARMLDRLARRHCAIVCGLRSYFSVSSAIVAERQLVEDGEKKNRFFGSGCGAE